MTREEINKILAKNTEYVLDDLELDIYSKIIDAMVECYNTGVQDSQDKIILNSVVKEYEEQILSLENLKIK